MTTCETASDWDSAVNDSGTSHDRLARHRMKNFTTGCSDRCEDYQNTSISSNINIV